MNAFIIKLLFVTTFIVSYSGTPNKEDVMTIEANKINYVHSDTLVVTVCVKNNQSERLRLNFSEQYKYTSPYPTWQMTILNEKQEIVMSPVDRK